MILLVRHISPCALLRNLLRMSMPKSWSECGWRNIATGFTCVGFSPLVAPKVTARNEKLAPGEDHDVIGSLSSPLTGTHPLSPQSSCRTLDFVCIVAMIHKYILPKKNKNTTKYINILQYNYLTLSCLCCMPQVKACINFLGFQPSVD